MLLTSVLSSGPSTNTLRAHGGEGMRVRTIFLGAWNSSAARLPDAQGASMGRHSLPWLNWLQSIASASPAAATPHIGKPFGDFVEIWQSTVMYLGDVIRVLTWRSPRTLRGRLMRFGEIGAGVRK